VLQATVAEEWLFPFNLSNANVDPQWSPTSAKAVTQKTCTADARYRQPLHKCVGHFCEQSLLVPLTSLEPIQAPYQVVVRYSLEPIRHRLAGRNVYLVALLAEKLRQLGNGSGLDALEARKSWLARSCQCSTMVQLATKSAGETCLTLDHQGLSGMQTVLLSVVGIHDMSDQQDWLTFGDPSVLHVVFPTIVDRTRHREMCVQAGTSGRDDKIVQASAEVASEAIQTWKITTHDGDMQTIAASVMDMDIQTDPPLVKEIGAQVGCQKLVQCAVQANAATTDSSMQAVTSQVETSSQTPERIMVQASTETVGLTALMCDAMTQIENSTTRDVSIGIDEPFAMVQDAVVQTIVEESSGIRACPLNVEMSTQTSSSQVYDIEVQTHLTSIKDISTEMTERLGDFQDSCTQADWSDQMVATLPSPQVAEFALTAVVVDASTQYHLARADASIQVESVECMVTTLPDDGCVHPCVDIGVQVNAGLGHEFVDACVQVDGSSPQLADLTLTSVVVDKRDPDVSNDFVHEMQDGTAYHEYVPHRTELTASAGDVAEKSGRRRVGTQTIVEGFVPKGEPKLKLVRIRPPPASGPMWQCLLLGLVSGLILGLCLSMALPR